MILAAFAGVVGVLTTRQVRGEFDNSVRSAAFGLDRQLNLRWSVPDEVLPCETISLSEYASAQRAQIRIYNDDGLLLCTQDQVRFKGAKPPSETPAFPAPSGTGSVEELGYRVIVHVVHVNPRGRVLVLYAAPLSDPDHTIARVQLFLLLGVLGGTVLALLAGLATAQRAIRPIVELTEAAREIERTRDPSRHVPLPRAEDEVAELARTLEGMLQSLDEARSGTEAMLTRQREFVADASHELRTPLTSVLASLELLAEELDGEQAETAEAALRSARRMRRLVGDLLLLARADAKRAPPRRPTQLDDVLMEAASEIGTVADDHGLQIDAAPVTVSAARDELHQLTLNLLENAVKHTPPGTHVRARTGQIGSEAVLIVEDDGPGIPPDLEQRVFERFVRGGRDGGRGSGLGLSIVRAVAQSHGGSVKLEPAMSGHGARFVVSLPALGGEANGAREMERVPAYTSTTTGRTIGRRRNRS